MTLADHRPVVLTEFEAHGGRGNRFEPIQERVLDPDLRSLAGQLRSSDTQRLAVAEFSGPRGVPDLLVLAHGFEDLGRRLASGIPFVLSPADCAVAAPLSVNRTMGVGRVAGIAGMSVEQVDRRLRALAGTGAVRPHGSGYRRADVIEPIGRTYAFEAKVSDWRRGLSQAIRYSTWADASSLVLLRPPADFADLLAICINFDIGLAVRDEWVRRPRLVRPQKALRLEASERLAFEVSRKESEPLTNCVAL